MTTIRLHNTRTRRKEEFVPLDPTNVRMYVCGPTVYDRAHLGNARPVVVFDVLYRLLRHVYGEGHVTYVRNFTDVDDKINDTASARKAAGDPRSLEELIRDRTDETIRWYHEDMDALGALRPTAEPRATEWIGAMVAMIGELIAKGHAYEADGHVLFRVRSYADYGALSGRSVDDMMAGARVEVAPYKEDPLDFVLWKPSGEDLPGWDSPWGRGRPGWHIECSAMARELLGASFDIHGGGLDLQFPHHENEIAQSECADPGAGFARVWMHNEMVLVDGKKMSKSLGNFFTVRDIINSYDAEFAIPNIGPALRLRFLQAHYRSPMDLDKGSIEAASAKLSAWYIKALGLWEKNEIEPARSKKLLEGTLFLSALNDDLNTAEAMKGLEQLAESALMPFPNGYILGTDDDFDPANRFQAALELLGFKVSDLVDLTHDAWSRRLARRHMSGDKKLEQVIADVLRRREQARVERQFAVADQLRAALHDAGVTVKDSPDGATWELTPNFNRSAIDSLSAMAESKA